MRNDKVSHKDFNSLLPALTREEEMVRLIEHTVNRMNTSMHEEFDDIKRITDAKVVKLR